ncbi:amidohydrolase family protein [Clostridium sp. AM58-1XD]|uniref:amidohydrolase family protein n=1 Tax=Clostridium sp. AM58-1XD TaxID=2292307 RepID=UPI0015F423A0|nr:amidohydrolase family protein [Clostridium sp. AM58-1XD]
MADYTILTADTLLAGKDLAETHNSCIVIENDLIKEILPTGAAVQKYGETADIHHLGNVTLMPGFIESHNHLSLDARLPGHHQMMNDSTCRLSVLALNSLHDDLMSGVTFARCMGDRDFIDTTLKEEIEKNHVFGPDLYTCGIGMRGLHGHGFVGLPHTGPEEFRRTARENMLHGCDHLKVFITAGAPPLKGNAPYFISYDEMKTVVEEGARLGLPVSAHCIGGEGLKQGIKAGIHAFDHLYCISDDELELLIKNDRWAILTAGNFLDPKREAFCPPSKVANVRRNRERVRERMSTILKSGIKFALGTDAFHTFLYKEAIYAHECGASVRESLKGITYYGACLCGMEHLIGSLDKGRKASIVALKCNPYQNLETLSSPVLVMKNGVIYKDCINS